MRYTEIDREMRYTDRDRANAQRLEACLQAVSAGKLETKHGYMYQRDADIIDRLEHSNLTQGDREYIKLSLVVLNRLEGETS